MTENLRRDLDSTLDRVAGLLDDLAGSRAHMQHLLQQIGSEGECPRCGQGILWIKHLNGKAAPYDYNGGAHFAVCPKDSQLRTRGVHASAQR